MRPIVIGLCLLLGLAALPLVGLLSLVPTLRRSGLRDPVS